MLIVSRIVAPRWTRWVFRWKWEKAGRAGARAAGGTWRLGIMGAAPGEGLFVAGPVPVGGLPGGARAVPVGGLYAGELFWRPGRFGRLLDRWVLLAAATSA